MNFIEKIIQNGFYERGQKDLLELMPHKHKHIPNWWHYYNYNDGWLGLTVYNPDAYFKIDNDNSKLLTISLQGILMAEPKSYEDKELAKACKCRYICLKVGNNILHETFTGLIPTDKIVDEFLSINQQGYNHSYICN